MKHKILAGIMCATALSVTLGATDLPEDEPTKETVEAKIVEIVEAVEQVPAVEKQEIEYIPSWSEADAKMLARLVWGEARGIPSDMEKAAVVWCVLNRVDAEGYGCGNSIEYVLTFPNQFAGYDTDHPVSEELYDLVVDVLTRWDKEKAGETEVGRVLPKEYLWFHGDGKHNHFRDAYKSKTAWDWSLPNPYET